MFKQNKEVIKIIEIWEGIKNVFKRKSSVEVTESGNTSGGQQSPFQSSGTIQPPFLSPLQKPILKNSDGSDLVCELCKDVIRQGEKKTWNNRKMHIKCYRLGIKAAIKQYKTHGTNEEKDGKS